MTKQVEYRGEMVDLTESLTHLPAGGQVVLSDATFQRLEGELHHVQLPAFTFQCPRSSLDTITGRALSKLQELVSMTWMHAVQTVIIADRPKLCTRSCMLTILQQSQVHLVATWQTQTRADVTLAGHIVWCSQL